LVLHVRRASGARGNQEHQMIRFIVAAAALGLVALSAQAADVTVGPLKISAAWARATPKGASVGGGYVTIANNGTASDRLIGGTTAVSERFEIHEMKMEDGVMKMRPVARGIEIKPGETVKLEPGGYHVMLVGLKKPLTQGEHFAATLEFEKAGKVDVDFVVEGIGATHGGGAPGMGGMHMK
jgi:copper(I)-binding protein